MHMLGTLGLIGCFLVSSALWDDHPNAVFSVVAALFMLPLGMLGDGFGRKAILSGYVGLWAVSQIVIGFSQNLTHALVTVGFSAIPFAGAMVVGPFILQFVSPRPSRS